MSIKFNPIGYVKTDEKEVTRCWQIADTEGCLVIDKNYQEGIKDLEIGQYIFVLFHNQDSPSFTKKNLIVSHPPDTQTFGVFSTHSSVRPIPIGMAFLEVADVQGDTIRVKGLDVKDGTSILDIKPDSCPWNCSSKEEAAS